MSIMLGYLKLKLRDESNQNQVCGEFKIFFRHFTRWPRAIAILSNENSHSKFSTLLMGICLKLRLNDTTEDVSEHVEEFKTLKTWISSIHIRIGRKLEKLFRRKCKWARETEENTFFLYEKIFPHMLRDHSFLIYFRVHTCCWTRTFASYIENYVCDGCAWWVETTTH